MVAKAPALGQGVQGRQLEIQETPVENPDQRRGGKECVCGPDGNVAETYLGIREELGNTLR